MKEGGLDLGERLAQVLRLFADMGDHIRDQHQAHAHGTLDKMSERKVRYRAMRANLKLGKSL